MAHKIDDTKTPYVTRELHGRRVIKVSVPEITRDNVVQVLQRVMSKHELNRSEIQYLWDYYRGKQPILYRQKEVRPEICNKIVENRANEIVSFKVGYLCGEPIQYVSRNGNEKISELITKLNEYMFAEDKASQDQELVEWQMICGTAFRLVLPDEDAPDIDEADEAPFEMYTLDPRNTFIVYSTEIGNKPLMAVKYSIDEETRQTTYSIYTENRYFRLHEYQIVDERPHGLGAIPIFEYPANNARLGSFEIVLPLLDMINNLESNAMDSVEQTVQAIMKFVNCDISYDDFVALKDLGAVKVKSVDGANADVDMITTDGSTSTTSETMAASVYNSVLTICGVPNRNGGTSTSDTGAAVLLRDGWSLAEARAKDSEHMFKKAEKKMLKLVLRICRDLSDVDLHLKDIDMKFTRRNYEAIQSKSQVLISMLQEPKIHPLLAFEHSGMFTDPESAYQVSMKYYEDQMSTWNPVEVAEDDETVSADGQVPESPENENQA